MQSISVFVDAAKFADFWGKNATWINLAHNFTVRLVIDNQHYCLIEELFERSYRANR